MFVKSYGVVLLRMVSNHSQARVQIMKTNNEFLSGNTIKPGWIAINSIIIQKYLLPITKIFSKVPTVSDLFDVADQVVF